MGPVDFKKPESIRELDANTVPKGLGSFLSSSQVICSLKPATEHCDETDGWFELMKGCAVIDNSNKFLCFKSQV